MSNPLEIALAAKRKCGMRLVLGIAFISLLPTLAVAKQPVRFSGPDWAVELSVTAVARVSAVTGRTWLYLDLDDERQESFGMLLSLVAHIYMGEKEFMVPMEVDVDASPRVIRRSFNKELEGGRIDRIFLTLERGYGTKTISGPRYDGPAFGDAGCIADYLRAKRMSGVAARELMHEVIATGCLRFTKEQPCRDVQEPIHSARCWVDPRQKALR